MSENEPLLQNYEQLPRDSKATTAAAPSNSFFETVVRPCVGELVGVALFVFVGTMSVAGPAGVLGVAVAHGLAIALLVAALAAVSGGHVNPVVTLGVFLGGEMAPLTAVLYIISQLLGSLTGAALTRGVLSQAAFVNISGGATLVGGDSSVSEALLCEVLLTSLLVLTVLLTAVDQSTKTSLAPIAIGFAVVACILAGGSVSGSSLNPARSLGPAVAMATFNSSAWDNHWLYWVGPALGSVLAVALYRLFLAGPEKRILGTS